MMRQSGAIHMSEEPPEMGLEAFVEELEGQIR
jgi:hypothetical protein